MRDFKYKSVFSDCSIVSATSTELQDRYLSLANIENLKDFDLDNVDLEKNIDLVLSIFNSAVINRVNKNGDAIDASTALKIKDLFVHKPQNIEHKKHRIVGHIVKAGWSKFQNSELLSDNDVKGQQEPFNMVLAGVVYRAIDKKFADYLVESTDESSEKFRKISASWEIGYDEYVILRAPEDNKKTRNVYEMERIKDAEEIKKYSKYLLANNGSGFDDEGRRIGRLIIGEAGEVLPMGIGFTFNPAAEVEGVITQDWTDFLTEEEIEERLSEASVLKKSDKKVKENSQKTKTNVNKDTENFSHSNKQKEFMKIESKKDLLNLLPEESQASAQEFISNEIEKISNEHEAKVQEKDGEIKARDEKISSLQSELEEAQSEISSLKEEKGKVEASISELQEEVKNIKAEAQAEKDEVNYQTRMAALNEEFELTDNERMVVASKIRGLSDEDYQNWYKEFETFANEKRKTVIAEKEKQLEEAIKSRVAQASQTQTPQNGGEGGDSPSNGGEEPSSESVASGLDKSQPNGDGNIPNAADGGERDLKSEWEEAFGESLSIKV